MANTVIQLKYSTVTAAPTTLNVAEPAYSYVSNTLFIGTPDSNGVLEIGGYKYVIQQQSIYDHANAAYNAANTGAAAQAAYDTANAAFAKANNEAGVNLTQNTNISAASSYANSSFIVANAASSYANSGFVVANAASSYANSGFAVANSAAIYANGAFAQANIAESNALSAGSYANSAFNTANTAATNALSAGSYANSAFLRANNSLDANNGGTVTGTVTISGDFNVSGNLTISGNTVTQNVTSLNITDPLIYLAANNYVSDLVDIGFVGNYYDGANQRHAGLVRHAADGNFYLFYNYDEEPVNNIIDINDASFREGTLHANLNATTVTISGVNIKTYVDNAYNAANTADDKASSAATYANGAFVQANTAATNALSAGSYANSAFAAANTADSKAVTAGSYANSGFAVANSAAIYANGAFAAANNEAGVNLTQNNNILAASSYANSAFAKANTDYTEISTSSGQYGNATAVAAFTLEANGRISQANATTIAISASQITSGTLSVARGGTGAGSFTTNGVLLGQGTSALTTASSSTEGHVLTINNAGVPTFAHLQGGTF